MARARDGISHFVTIQVHVTCYITITRHGKGSQLPKGLRVQGLGVGFRVATLAITPMATPASELGLRRAALSNNNAVKWGEEWGKEGVERG